MHVSRIALALTLASTTPAIAEDAPTDTAANGAIIVTAARGTALKDLDVSATVLTRDRLAATPATATDQLINHIPGVFTLNQPAAMLHPTGDTFSIRGFGTTTNVNTLVMLDGMPMNDPYFRVVDWNQIAKAQIDRIEVIRGGGATSLWGNMAMGGIVNIVSARPAPGHMDLDIDGGSHGTLSATARGGIAVAPDVVAGFTVSETRSDGYDKTPVADRNPFMTATSSHNTNLGGSLRGTPSATTDWWITGNWHRLQEQGLV